MSDVKANNLNSILSPQFQGEHSGAFNLEANSGSNMKLSRPKVSSADFTNALNNYTKYSNAESKKQLKAIDKDIYQRAKKEKDRHEFNFKRYFTIFGILGLLTAAITYFRRGK